MIWLNVLRNNSERACCLSSKTSELNEFVIGPFLLQLTLKKTFDPKKAILTQQRKSRNVYFLQMHTDDYLYLG